MMIDDLGVRPVGPGAQLHHLQRKRPEQGDYQVGMTKLFLLTNLLYTKHLFLRLFSTKADSELAGFLRIKIYLFFFSIDGFFSVKLVTLCQLRTRGNEKYTPLLVCLVMWYCLFQKPRVLHEERSDHLQRVVDELRDGGEGSGPLRGDRVEQHRRRRSPQELKAPCVEMSRIQILFRDVYTV